MRDWLALCAVHSDAWLMSLLFFWGARFNHMGRGELFALANQHPTVYEVVTGRAKRNTIYKKADIGGLEHETNGMAGEPAIRAAPSGRIIGPEEIGAGLCGRLAELYWPDDGKWYLVEIQAIDLDTKMAKYVHLML